jgi:hypothetical protein
MITPFIIRKFSEKKGRPRPLGTARAWRGFRLGNSKLSTWPYKGYSETCLSWLVRWGATYRKPVFKELLRYSGTPKATFLSGWRQHGPNQPNALFYCVTIGA